MDVGQPKSVQEPILTLLGFQRFHQSWEKFNNGTDLDSLKPLKNQGFFLVAPIIPFTPNFLSCRLNIGRIFKHDLIPISPVMCVLYSLLITVSMPCVVWGVEYSGHSRSVQTYTCILSRSMLFCMLEILLSSSLKTTYSPLHILMRVG